jgi:hypothetical protein
MTDGTNVLGRNGEQLVSIAGPLLEADVDDVENERVGQEHVFDGGPVAERLSPELAVWLEQKLGPRLRDDHGTWTPPACGMLFAASRAEDAWWMIRLQSIFLPVSTVLLRGEVYFTASWHPTRFGTSRVYATHQDEPGVWRRHGSLAGLLADTVAGDDELDLDAETREAYRAADAALGEADSDEFPDHLDPEKLQVRTRWIGELLIGQHVSLFDTTKGLYYDRLQGIPTFDTYAAERPLVAEWPHLQAYWIVHHMLLRNEEALADVLQLADDRYPPIPELRMIAEAFEVGNEPRQLVGFGAHQALRWDIVKNDLGAMDPTATAEVAAQIAERDRLRAVADATLQTLTQRTDDATTGALEIWSMMGSCAGAMKEGETALLSAFYEDDEAARSAMRTRVTTGETTPFIRLFARMLEQVDQAWAPLFEAAFTAGATVDEDHEDAAPGALVGWGKALGSFSALAERFDALCKSAGRRRYLELAMVADHFYDDPKSEAFLLRELNDFLGEIGNWERSTMSFAFFALVAREHPDAIEAANAVLERGPMNGASWQTLLALVELAESGEHTALVPGLQALVARDFGRHDDGTRGRVVRTWARMGGADTVPTLEAMLGDIRDVRRTCEEAELLAGLLTAQADHPGAVERAANCVDELLDKGGSMELGAAAVLIGAMQDAGVAGADDLAGRHPSAAG